MQIIVLMTADPVLGIATTRMGQCFHSEIHCTEWSTQRLKIRTSIKPGYDQTSYHTSLVLQSPNSGCPEDHF